MTEDEVKDLWYQFLRSPNVKRERVYTMGAHNQFQLALLAGEREIARLYMGDSTLSGFGHVITLDAKEYKLMCESWENRDLYDYSYKEILKML